MSGVSILKVNEKDVTRAVRKAVSTTQGFDSIQWQNANALIKPNTVNPSESGSGKVTDARVVAAVVDIVKSKNPRRIVIGEGSSVGYDFPGREDSIHCMKAAGVLDVAEKYGLELGGISIRMHRLKVKLSQAYVMDSFQVEKTA